MHNKQSVSDGPRNSFFFSFKLLFRNNTQQKLSEASFWNKLAHILGKKVPVGEGVERDASAFVKVHEILKN